MTTDVGAATPAEVDARIQAVVGAAPAALDTLQELGAALGNDRNFAATVTTALGGKAALSHTHTPAETGAAPAVHVHDLGDVGGLQPVLDGKAAVVHGHVAGDVSGLGNAATRNVGTTAGTVAAGDDARLAAAVSALQMGKHTAFFPGSTIKAAATNGCTANQETEVANQPPVAGADFDPSTEQYGRLVGAVPKSADGGAIDVMLTWCRTDASMMVLMASSVRAAYLSPGAARPNWSTWVDLSAVALTFQNQDETTGYVTLTPGGTAVNEAILVIEVRRKAADAADTLAVKARCTGCFVRYTINASTDA